MATPKRGGHDSALAGMLGVQPPNMQKAARCAGEIEGLSKDIPSGKTARLQTAKKAGKDVFYRQRSDAYKGVRSHHSENFPLSTLNDIRSFINRQLAELSRIILIQPIHEQE